MTASNIGPEDSLITGVDLTGKEGFAVKITQTGADKGKLELADANSDIPVGIVTRGAGVGKTVVFRPFGPTVRVSLAATLNPGVRVTYDAAGEMIAAAASKFSVGILKEGGVDGDVVPMYLVNTVAGA